MQKKGFILLLLVLFILLGGIGFSAPNRPITGDPEFDALLHQVLRGEKTPEELTDRVIVKVFKEDGSFEYQSILKEDYLVAKNDGDQTMEFVQPDYICYAYESAKGNPGLSWGRERIGAQGLIDKIGSTSEPIIVAVLDTGVDHDHPFLRARMVPGYNFIEGNTNTMDRAGHGTHVAGIITDTTTANVKIMPVKVLGDHGWSYGSSVIDGIRYAVDHGAKVINMSLGGLGPSPLQDEAIQYATERGVMVVVAAGNESCDTKIVSPASNMQAIVVSATDEQDQFAPFSNFGASIDVASPGTRINSSVPGGGYEEMGGTSMATPYVAGLVALLRTEDPQRSLDQIERILKTYTDDCGPAGWDDHFGEGIVNVKNYAKGEAFALLSPTEGQTLYEEMNIKYYAQDAIGAEAIVKLNGQVAAKRTINKQGHGGMSVPLDSSHEGKVTLSFSIVKQGKELYQTSRNVYIEWYNTTFEAYNEKGEKAKNFGVRLFGIKDKKAEVISSFGSLVAIGDRIRLRVDYDTLMAPYDELVAVAYDATFLSLPVQSLSISGPGQYTFRKSNYQKVTFNMDLAEPELQQPYSAEVSLRYKDIFLPAIPLYNKRLYPGEQAAFYAEEGKHNVAFGGFSVTFIETLKGQGENALHFSEYEGKKIKFWCEPSLNSGKEQVSAYIDTKEPGGIFYKTLGLEPGDSLHLLKEGSYRIVYIKEVKDKGVIFFANEFSTADISDGQSFRYGGFLQTRFIPDEAHQVGGQLYILDPYGNRVSESFYWDYGTQSIEASEEGNISKDPLPEELTPRGFFNEQQAVLYHPSTGAMYGAVVDKEGRFAFREDLPDGSYVLYIDYESSILPYDFRKIDVEIRDHRFVPKTSYDLTQAVIQGDVIKISQGGLLGLNLDEIFNTQNGSYQANVGRVQGSFYQYQGHQVGKFPVTISSNDGTSYSFYIQVVGQEKPLIVLSEIEKDHGYIRVTANVLDENQVKGVAFYRAETQEGPYQKVGERDIWEGRDGYKASLWDKITEEKVYFYKAKAIGYDGKEGAFSNVLSEKGFICDQIKTIKPKDSDVLYQGQWTEEGDAKVTREKGASIRIPFTGHWGHIRFVCDEETEIEGTLPDGQTTYWLMRNGESTLSFFSETRIEGGYWTFVLKSGSMAFKEAEIGDKSGTPEEPEEPIDVYPEHKSLGEKKDVSLDKVWTILLSRSFEETEIKHIKVLKGKKEVPLKVSYVGAEKKVVVTAENGYEAKGKYILLVELKNGKKYKLIFSTK